MYRYRLYEIIKEIDEGIETIKPLLSGETRQIAECQIIGLEEAKKIVEKYMKVTQEGKLKRIKLFAPHAEIRVYITEQMEKDLLECDKMIIEHDTIIDCDNCSWKDCRFADFDYLCDWITKEMLEK